MKLLSTIKVAQLKKGSFENDEKETVEYFQVQFLDTITKKLGDDYIECQDVATIGVTADLAAQIEEGETYTFELRAQATNPKSGFPQVKYKIVGIEA